MRFAYRENGPLVWLQAEGFNDSGVVHGFSTRKGGVSEAPFDTLSFRLDCGDREDAVRENYRRFFEAIGADLSHAVCSKQVHKDHVRRVTAADAGKGLDRERDYEADGLITNERGIPLVIFSADCIPVLLYDPVKHAAGACHAGWRGTALGIPAKTVRRMTEEFGTDPKDLRCAIGMGISQCCFETDANVPDAMREALGAQAEAYFIDHGTGKYHVDLKAINRHWLIAAGVPAEHIAVSDACTACRTDLFFSHRRTGNQRGALAAVIQLL